MSSGSDLDLDMSNRFNELKRGQYTGETSIFVKEVREFTAICYTFTELFKIKREEFFEKVRSFDLEHSRSLVPGLHRGP
jgi:CRP-like cAMP-binding protein